MQTVPAVGAADDNSSLAKAAGLLRASCPSPFALRPSPFALRASLRLFKIAPGDFVSLHAGVASEADEREKLERLCRYITRPAVSTERLSLTAQGNIRYRLAAPAHPARAAFVHPCTALRASKIQW